MGAVGAHHPSWLLYCQTTSAPLKTAAVAAAGAAAGAAAMAEGGERGGRRWHRQRTDKNGRR
ncbi:MAG: hypothetical protein GY772_30340 [bacterium]|nr:hypothetical protein [bacterium]